MNRPPIRAAGGDEAADVHRDSRQWRDTRIGNSSGWYSDNQPKNGVATSPCAKTIGRKLGCKGAVSRNIAQVSVVALRLFRKYEVSPADRGSERHSEKTANDHANRPPLLRCGLISGLRRGTDLLGPRDHPFAAGPCAN